MFVLLGGGVGGRGRVGVEVVLGPLEILARTLKGPRVIVHAASTCLPRSPNIENI